MKEVPIVRKQCIRMATVAVVALLASGLFLVHANSAHAGSGHAPIVIQSDSDFTSCVCVSSGSGTTADPYIIGPLSISNANGAGVFVDGTHLTKSFELLNLTITNSSTGIVLNHINPSGSQTVVAKVYGSQTSIQNNSVGVLVENSNDVTLDGAGANPNGQGVGNTGAGTVNKNTSGAFDIENSSSITITGWQMSTNGPSINPNWVTLDPSVSDWGVGGVRFFGVTNSTIDHNSANNDTDVSYALFHSNQNTVSNNTADYPFTMNYLVTDGSSSNTLNNNQGSTGDFIGLLVADPLPGTSTLSTYGPSHDNLIENMTIQSDGPTGNEIHAGVAPAFLGGLVVLNGTYNNTIRHNQVFVNTGSDLAWAQAVPNNTTPIGVDNYPPTLHCNVTASEGGGGASNLNGNVWTGNASKNIDPCLPAQ